jgi:CRP-like cAMP-binding protein
MSRELLLTAVGAGLGGTEPWVTDRLAAIAFEEEIAAGEPIFAAGDPPDHFYVVRQGRLEVVRGGRRSEVIEAPGAFGMLDALAERPRRTSAYARTRVELLRIRMDAWIELLEDSFELARTLVRRLANSVAILEEGSWSRGRRAQSGAPPVVESERLDIVERVAILMQTPLLRGAGVQPLSDLATASEEVWFGAGDRLFARGAAPAKVIVLIDGEVEASREAPNVIWRGTTGQIVCGVAPFSERSGAWEAHALRRSRALVLSIDDWFDVMEENFEMVRATLAALATEHERLVGALGSPDASPLQTLEPSQPIAAEGS